MRKVDQGTRRLLGLLRPHDDLIIDVPLTV